MYKLQFLITFQDLATSKFSLPPGTTIPASLVPVSKPPSSLTNIEDFLKDQNRSLYNVAADGNCMFRALSHQLCGSEEHHIQLRSMLLQVIQSNYDTYCHYWIEDMPWGVVTFDEHLNDLGKPGIWGTQVELQACSDCLNITIYICSPNPNGIVRWEKKATPKKLISVPQNLFTTARCSHIELSFYKSHYNSVVPIQGVVPPPVIMMRHSDTIVI